MGYGKTDALRHFIRKLPRLPGSPNIPDAVFKVKGLGGAKRSREQPPGISLTVGAVRQWACDFDDVQVLQEVPEYAPECEAWVAFDAKLGEMLRGEMRTAYNKRKDRAVDTLKQAVHEMASDCRVSVAAKFIITRITLDAVCL